MLLEDEIYGQIKYCEMELLNSSTEHVIYFKPVKFPYLLLSLVVEPKDSTPLIPTPAVVHNPEQIRSSSHLTIDLV
jgi:hypothetical protein